MCPMGNVVNLREMAKLVTTTVCLAPLRYRLFQGLICGLDALSGGSPEEGAILEALPAL
jgi:hypothetical protein